MRWLNKWLNNAVTILNEIVFPSLVKCVTDQLYFSRDKMCNLYSTLQHGEQVQ